MIPSKPRRTIQKLVISQFAIVPRSERFTCLNTEKTEKGFYLNIILRPILSLPGKMCDIIRFPASIIYITFCIITQLD